MGLASWFTQAEDWSKQDHEFEREDITNEVLGLEVFAWAKEDCPARVWTIGPKYKCLIEPDEKDPNLLWFDIVGRQQWFHVRLWWNRHSVIDQIEAVSKRAKQTTAAQIMVA
jgi:hypothetical protein